MVFMLSGYFVNIWLGRTLGPEDYGVYGLITSLMTIFTLIQLSGIPQATSKYVAEEPNSSDAVFRAAIKLQVVTAITFSLLFYLLAIPLSAVFNDSRLVPFLQLTSIIFLPNAIFSLLVGYYNGMHLFGKQAATNIIYSVIKTFGVITLTLFYGLKGAIYAFALTPIITVLMAGQFPKRSYVKFSYKKLVTFAMPLIVLSLVSTLQISLDLFVVKILSNNIDSAGLYTAAQNIARIPFAALNAVSVVMFPIIARHAVKSITLANDTIQDSFKYMIAILLPATALIITSSNALVTILYGDEYSGSAPALSVLVGTYALLTVFIFLTTALNALNKGTLSWKYSAYGVAVSCMMFPLSVPTLGLAGAGISTGAGAAVSLFLAFRALRRISGFKVVPNSFIKILITTFIIGALNFYITMDDWLLFPWFTSLFLLYIYALILLKVFTKNEIFGKLPFLGNSKEEKKP